MLELYPHPQDIANGYSSEPTRAELIAEVERLRLAFHAAINNPKGVVPAGFEDFYEPFHHEP